MSQHDMTERVVAAITSSYQKLKVDYELLLHENRELKQDSMNKQVEIDNLRALVISLGATPPKSSFSAVAAVASASVRASSSSSSSPLASRRLMLGSGDSAAAPQFKLGGGRRSAKSPRNRSVAPPLPTLPALSTTTTSASTPSTHYNYNDDAEWQVEDTSVEETGDKEDQQVKDESVALPTSSAEPNKTATAAAAAAARGSRRKSGEWDDHNNSSSDEGVSDSSDDEDNDGGRGDAGETRAVPRFRGTSFIASSGAANVELLSDEAQREIVGRYRAKTRIVVQTLTRMKQERNPLAQNFFTRGSMQSFSSGLPYRILIVVLNIMWKQSRDVGAVACLNRYYRSAVRKYRTYDRRRHKITLELCDTEVSYLQALDEGFNVAKGISLSDAERRQIFQNAETLVSINLSLLREIRLALCNWSESTCIGDIFNRLGPSLKLYSIYSAGWDSSNSLLEHMLKRKRITETQFAMLARALITPIQRIPRYVLLLKELYQHTTMEGHPDRQSLTNACKVIDGIGTSLEAAIAHREQQKELQDIQDVVMGLPQEFTHGLVELVKTDTLRLLGNKGKNPLYLMVLTKTYLLCAKKAKKKKWSFVSGSPLEYCVVCPSPLYPDHGFNVVSQTLKETFLCQSTALRDEWIKMIKENVTRNMKASVERQLLSLNRSSLRKK